MPYAGQNCFFSVLYIFHFQIWYPSCHSFNSCHTDSLVCVVNRDFGHGSMAMGGHGLPKVLPGPAMPYPSTPCRQATPITALWPFQGWPAHRAGRLRPFSTPLDTPRRTPMLSTVTLAWILGFLCRDLNYSNPLFPAARDKK
jgi:hypothetical protein